MARDMHLIIGMYQEADDLYKKGKSEEAAKLLRGQYQFFQSEAELSEGSGQLAASYVRSDQRLLAKIEGRKPEKDEDSGGWFFLFFILAILGAFIFGIIKLVVWAFF